MFHFYQPVQNRAGDALAGYFVQVVDATDAIITLASDSSGTPIITASGIANMAKVGTNGMVSFYIADGSYTVKVFAADGVTYRESYLDVPMISTLSMTIGTVTTLPPSSAATASITTGTGGVALNLGLPAGASGAGTGDVIAANNLSDLANKATAKDNITLKGTDIASAATTNLATATGDYVDVTGVVTITALGTATAGVERQVRFTGALTLTYNATSLILPGGASIATAAGDTARFRSLGAGNWLCVAYNRASGVALAATAFPLSIQSVASAATVTPTFTNDQVNVTAQAAALALANPTGTAVDGWGVSIRIKDNGTSRAITFGTQYRAVGVALPTATVATKTLYLGCVWNVADTKFDVLALAQE